MVPVNLDARAEETAPLAAAGMANDVVVDRPGRMSTTGERNGMIVRALLGVLGVCLLVSSAARAVDGVSLVEDWTQQVIGAGGVPAGWKRYETPGGRPRYDFTVVGEDGVRGLRVRSRDEHSTIAKEVHVDLRATPILEWSWKVVKLPEGGDVRKKETSDLTGHLLLGWPRAPALLRTRLIGYAWEATAPAPTMERSRKSSLVTFFVLRSGPAEVGRWIVERRNIRDDYARAFGEEPPSPGVVAISIDTNDTHSTAEAVIGRIAFIRDGARPPR